MPWRDIDISDSEARTAARSFAKKARFLVDENVDSDVAAFVRSKRYNVRTTTEAGLHGHPDENVLALALREDRILLTHDRGYLNDRRFPPNRNPGVVVLPGGDGDTEALVVGLIGLLAIVAPYRGFYRNAKAEIGGDGTLRLTMREHETGKMATSRYLLGKSPRVWIDA